MKQIGFIGVGIMGKSMARNLMKHGYTVHVYARTPKKAQDLIEEGAILHPSIAQCVKASEAVITMVGYPSDVEEVYCGENGIFASAKEGTLLIDMTTSSPKLACSFMSREDTPSCRHGCSGYRRGQRCTRGNTDDPCRRRAKRL